MQKGIARWKWQLGLVAVLIISVGIFLLKPAKPEPPLTLEQAKNLSFRVSIKGVPFDVPVNYHYTQYSYFKIWPRPPQNQIDKVERKEIDYIKVAALLPDMLPYTEENAAEFETSGWGKKVTILFGQEKNLDLTYISKLEKFENSKLPGMLQYENGIGRNDTFISQDYLISVRCDSEPSKKGRYPSCEVLRPYHYKQANGATAFPVLHLRYHFSRDYLQQWREIDEKVIALFDRFAGYAQ